MGIIFQRQSLSMCCLCGSTDQLSGEHKIKASVIREQFGSSKMVIGSADGPKKNAQSPKSKAFHFEARMCVECNGTRTQPADREFERMNAAAMALLSAGKDPKLVFEDARYEVGSEAYLNCFRYFAKLLCCHLAEVSSPRLVHLSNFAMGRLSRNCVWLDIDADWTFKQLQQEYGVSQYAAHGGLVVYAKKKDSSVTGFHSTLTIGPLRYIFWTRLSIFERFSMRWFYPEFREWCRMKAHDTEEHDLPRETLLKLGLLKEDEVDYAS
jgi:hypothetical protein